MSADASAVRKGRAMTAAPRITDLDGPPVVGRRYWVPTVTFAYTLWVEAPRAWPVFLPRHSDAEFFDFPDPHYHVDPRFIGPAVWRRLGYFGGIEDTVDTAAYAMLQSMPLARRRDGVLHPPAPVWRLRMCCASQFCCSRTSAVSVKAQASPRAK